METREPPSFNETMGPPARAQSLPPFETNMAHLSPLPDLFISPKLGHTDDGFPIPPPKRRRLTDESITDSFLSQGHHSPASAADRLKLSYVVHDPPPPAQSTVTGASPTTSENLRIARIVEAEYRRLADTAAAAVPPPALLSPAIWKERFFWPNAFTTKQCACLMRYYVDHLARAVRGTLRPQPPWACANCWPSLTCVIPPGISH